MPTHPLVSNGRDYVLDNAGEYIVAPSTGPNQPLVTPNASLTSKARHVVARSSGKEVFTRGGTGPLVTPKSPLIVR